MKILLKYILVLLIIGEVLVGCSNDDNEQRDLELANTVWIYKSYSPEGMIDKTLPTGIYALCFSDYDKNKGGLVMLYQLDENLKKQRIGLGYGYLYHGNKVIIGDRVCEIYEYWITYKDMKFFKSPRKESDLF